MIIEPTPASWKGRTDTLDGIDGNRIHHIVQLGPSRQEKSVNLLGFACDEGVFRNQGRIGAKNGPPHIRAALANLAVHQPIQLHDLGDVACHDKNLESAQAEYAVMGAQVISRDQILIGIGGGHEIAFASYLALRQAKPKAKIGILNFDAHFDLRRDKFRTSGTGFLDALEHSPLDTSYFAMGISAPNNTQALFRTAQKNNVHFRLDDHMTANHAMEAAAALTNWLATIETLYMTIDLDCFPSHEAPGVSAPATRGVSYEVVEPLVRLAASSGKLAVADVAELNPSHDIDNRTARLAARLVYVIANTVAAPVQIS